MASAPHLPKHLRAALGADAGVELVTILDEIRADRRHAEQLHQEQMARIDLRFAHIDQRFDRLEDHMRSLDTRMGALEVKLGDVKADLMKWSFLFWVGAVSAIAALAGVLK